MFSLPLAKRGEDQGGAGGKESLPPAHWGRRFTSLATTR
jgi:hypothetical protein